MAEQFTDNSLWQFTLDCYASRRTQECVLSLQKELDADVNLLFYCCWLAVTGRGRIGRAEVRKADRALSAWRERITLPLRHVRNELHQNPKLQALSGAEETRGKIIAAEIESERVAQTLLERQAPAAQALRPESPPAADALANLRTYLSEMLNPDIDVGDRLELLVEEAVSGSVARSARR